MYMCVCVGVCVCVTDMCLCLGDICKDHSWSLTKTTS